MKELVRHLWLNNRTEIVERSLLNCHCKGLHSIMLLESPGKTIRLYVAVKGNDLNRNFPYLSEKPSLAFHPHHCNLTLHCIKGEGFLNWGVVECQATDDRAFDIDKFLYRSKISQGELAFEPLGVSYLRTTKMSWVSPGESIHLKAQELHTVACPNDELTAWLVYEGEEDKNYIPYCWSSSNPNIEDFTGLYGKPSVGDIELLLRKCDLI